MGSDKDIKSPGDKQKVSDDAESLFEDDGDDMDMEDNETLEKLAKANDSNHREARRRLEDYLEEKRLRKELGDDFDF